MAIRHCVGWMAFIGVLLAVVCSRAAGDPGQLPPDFPVDSASAVAAVAEFDGDDNMTEVVYPGSDHEPPSLERNVGIPLPHDWHNSIPGAASSDPDVVPMLKKMEQYNVPAATIGWQLNVNRSYLDNTQPQVFQSPQGWWMYGAALPAHPRTIVYLV
jgi:hypothetical protein